MSSTGLDIASGTDSRAVSAPIDMIDQLGGWSLQTVGQGYGDGYDLVSLMQVMSQLQRNLEPDHSS